jgi:hypothetical protein
MWVLEKEWGFGERGKVSGEDYLIFLLLGEV